MTDLADWQLISIILSILGSAVGVTYFLTRKITASEINVKNLKEQIDKAEDDITYIFRLDLEESRRAAGKIRNELKSTKQDQER